MSNFFITSLLQSLQYPQHASDHLNNAQHLQSLVVWLENTKIRHYPLEARAHLQSADAAVWQSALQRYLVDVGCPLQLEGDSSEILVTQWLLSYAVGLEYHDHADKFNESISQKVQDAQSPEEWAPTRLPPLSDVASPQVHAALRTVLKTLRIESANAHTLVSVEDLQRARDVLEAQILPTLAHGEREPDGHAAPLAALAQCPLGFSTGDGDVDVAATVLRMLYIKDLRELQTAIDEAIVAGQELTADPRTDTSIGRVGR